MQRHDNLIYELQNHKMVRVGEPKGRGGIMPDGTLFKGEDRDNFIIVCVYGDWSGYRTLKRCLDQLNNDPSLLKEKDGYFQIVERL